MSIKLTVLCAKEESGAYVAVCPDVDGCFTQADTYEDAIKNLTELVAHTVREDLDGDDRAFLARQGKKIITEIEISA